MKDPDAFTAAYFISRKGKQHYFTYFRRDSAASRMTPGFLPQDYIAGAKLLHVSGISQAISVSASARRFRPPSPLPGRLEGSSPTTPTFGPSSGLSTGRGRSSTTTCRQADLIFPSLDDARQLTGIAAPEEIARFYLGLGPKVVVVKLGAEGALLATADGLRRFPPYKVDAIDMSGAGDTFDGAFVAGYLAGRPVDECMRFANAAAAITTTGLGCVTPVPRLKEIEAFVARQPR